MLNMGPTPRMFPRYVLLRKHGWVSFPCPPNPRRWWVYHISSCFSALTWSFAWEGGGPREAQEMRRPGLHLSRFNILWA